MFQSRRALMRIILICALGLLTWASIWWLLGRWTAARLWG